MLLVTGITGRSGRHFLGELERHEYPGVIRCIVRAGSNTDLLDRSRLTIEKIVHDLERDAFDGSIMTDVSDVVHISHLSHTPKLLKAAIKHNVKRFIAVHTTGVYSKFKMAADEYKTIEQEVETVRKSGDIGYVCLRPTMIYGGLDDSNMSVFIKMVDRLRIFPVVDGGKVLLQPVNVRDLGKAYYAILADNKVRSGDYILSGEAPVSMIEILKAIAEGLRKKTFFISVPAFVAVSGAQALKILSFGKFDLVEKVLRMTEDRHFPHDAARRDFGYEPMKFADGLRIEIEQYKNARNRKG